MPKKPASVQKSSNRLLEAAESKDWTEVQALIETGALETLQSQERVKMAEIFYMQGMLFLESADDITAHEMAKAAFSQALKLDPTSLVTAATLAHAALKAGLLSSEEQPLIEARDFFTRADLLYKENNKTLPLESLWDWSVCLYCLAKSSEEAGDFKIAIDKFKEAYEAGQKNPRFLLDFGTALGELGVLVGQEAILLEATEILEESINTNSEFALTWLRLACIYKILYFASLDIGFFEKADQAFVAAARLDGDPQVLWLNWGQLLSLEGKTTRDSELLAFAVEKLDNADRERPNDPVILSFMGDTLMHLGLIEEDFEFLKEAESCLEQALLVPSPQQDSLCLLGHCLVNIGKYLSDVNYIDKAIEKFQVGISQYPKLPLFWHGLAMAYFAKGDLATDAKSYEKSIKFIAESIKLSGDVPSYYNDWGVSLMKLGELVGDAKYIAEAIEKFEEAIHAFNRKSGGTPDPEWYYNYGCALDWLGDFELNPLYFERAIAILSRLLEQYPQFHHARYNLAMAYYHLGDAIGEVEPLEKSLEYFDSVLEQDNEDDGVFLDVGIVCLTLGDLLQEEIHNQKSIEWFQKAEHYLIKSIALGGLRANYYMACVKSILGQLPEALQFLKRAKTLHSLPEQVDLLEDEWLENLRQTPAFKAFLAELVEEN